MTVADTASPIRYSAVQVGLHWLIAALIIVQYLIHTAIERAFDQRADGATAAPSLLALLHIVVGGSILLLAVLRIGIRLWQGVPPGHGDVPWPVLRAGQAVHLGLYGLLFLLPMSGAWAWALRSELAAELHEWGTHILLLLVGAHVAGAMVEHFLFRNDTLARMLPGLTTPLPPPSKTATSSDIQG